MPTPLLANLFSHWHKPYDAFQTSVQDFYSAVEAGLEQRQVPEISTARIDWREGGIGTPKREYLRVSRKEVAFDICAAPVGRGFFFSWWMGSTGAGLLHWVITVLVGSLFLKVATLIIPGRGFLEALIAIILVIPFLRLVALVSRALGPGIDDAAGKIPILGLLYRLLFIRITYYQQDTMVMFQSVVHGVVCEVIDSLTTAKGLRALGADEKKPIMQDLLKR